MPQPPSPRSRTGILEGTSAPPDGVRPGGLCGTWEDQRLTTKDRVTGRDVIVAIGENMRQSLEPLVTKTIAPSLYQIYLHPDDYDHLRTLFGELEGEAGALLDGELERMNRGSMPAAFSRLLRNKMKEGTPQAPKFVSAE